VAAAARKAEEERQAKAEEEARQRAAAEAEAARNAEAERQAKAEEAARQRAAAEAEAEAARKAEAERQAKAEEEARQRAAAEAARKSPAITGNPADAARYLARAQQHITNGDFASGRLFLERASDSGSADAALLLAETYDAVAQKRLGAVGIAANIALARRWYQRAADLGSTVAAERLKQLGSQ
jgi:membrane protein involved in colicin uptake